MIFEVLLKKANFNVLWRYQLKPIYKIIMLIKIPTYSVNVNQFPKSLPLGFVAIFERISYGYQAGTKSNGVRKVVSNNPKNPIIIDQIKLGIKTDSTNCKAVIKIAAINSLDMICKIPASGNSIIAVFDTVIINVKIHADNNETITKVITEMKLAINTVTNFEK